jgi:hypothetical protein
MIPLAARPIARWSKSARLARPIPVAMLNLRILTDRANTEVVRDNAGSQRSTCESGDGLRRNTSGPLKKADSGHDLPRQAKVIGVLPPQ